MSPKKQLEELGYRLVRNYRCPIRGKTMPYARLPLHTGSVVVFHTIDEVKEHTRKMVQMREWMEAAIVNMPEDEDPR